MNITVIQNGSLSEFRHIHSCSVVIITYFAQGGYKLENAS